ncbi:XK-related protein 8-like isoform X1 [Pristis pectinata]|uniref:XK-related protein 8-like isoform X1 n=1 Tax=Pristis pectinata TaxID=685728 RepID=UPI00223E8E4D|nr:XK-related protein 8-like isoform X1 [Pristis pectinata]
MYPNDEIRFSVLDLLFIWLGLGTFLLDLGTDAWVAFSFYLAGDYFWGSAVLILVLLCSAVVQLFSWFWFAGDREQLESFSNSGRLPKLKATPGDRVLGLLHWFQLGFLVRYVAALELGFRVYKEKETMGLQYAIYLACDISMLRLFESIFESAPQLALMLYIIMEKNQMEIHQYFSLVASFLSIAWALLDFHQSLRKSLSDKMHLRLKSAVPYFLCNLLLIWPRIVSIALFATVFRQYVFLHFAMVWLPMFFWAWQQGTTFMNSFPEEVFYRGTVAVILYFTWLNVAEGKTCIRQIIYHSFIAVDCGILVGFWWLHRDPVLTAPYTVQLLIGASSSYLIGVIVKCVYYKYLHPFVTAEHLPSTDETDSLQEDAFRSICESRPLMNKRMKILSNSFYYLLPEGNSFITKIEETKI